MYTVGHRASYEQCFEEQGKVVKVGIMHGYTGGSAYRTILEAKRSISDKPDYAVYRLCCDETNTYPLNGNLYLIHNTRVEKLPELKLVKEF